MLAGKHFILCGLNPLTLRVTKSLLELHASVAVLITPKDNASLSAMLDDEVQQLRTSSESADDALNAVGVQTAHCVLILGEDDLTNLRFTIAVHALTKTTPVVLRAFDPVLADQFEGGLNVRRAFSVSGLSAPTFAASACGSTVIETLRLGDDTIPISTTTINSGSDLIGKTIDIVEEQYEVSIIGFQESDKHWIMTSTIDQENVRLMDGMVIAFGGPNTNCLRLASACNEELGRAKTPSFFDKIKSAFFAVCEAPAKIADAAHNSRHKFRRSATWMPKLTAGLLSIVLISVFVFKSALHLSLVDAIYFVMTTVTTTGYGDISTVHSSAWIKLFNGVIMLTGGALLGILFSYLAAVATAERLDTEMSKRAQGMKDHVVVIGLGNVGFRTAKSLLELGRGVVVMDSSPRERFAITLGGDVPILRGDARQSESLNRLGIKDARAIIACTSDELVNVEACLHARRLNPNVRTIARVFDETMAKALADVFKIDIVLSSNAIAESAFVAAATDESVLRRIYLGHNQIHAGRIKTKYAVAPQDIKRCHEKGVEFMAFKTIDGKITTKLKSTDVFEAIVYGPAAELRELSTTVWQSVRPNSVLRAGVYNRHKGGFRGKL